MDHKLLSGYKVYLTPKVKPDREQMSDIIICSGGEPSNFMSSLPQGPKVIVISCEEDLNMCRPCMEAGQPVHSAELILGGVLKQELSLTSYPSFFSVFYTVVAGMIAVGCSSVAVDIVAGMTGVGCCCVAVIIPVDIVAVTVLCCCLPH